MKNITYKKSKKAKLIALWLVFAMLITPLMDSSGVGKSTKAADFVEQVGIINETVSTDGAEVVVTYNPDADDSSKNTVNFAPKALATNTNPITVYAVEDMQKVVIGASDSLEVQPVLKNSSGNEYKPNVGYIYGVLTYSDINDVAGEVSGNDSLSGLTGGYTYGGTDNNIIAIYAKANTYRVETGIKDEAGNSYVKDNYTTTYTLQAVYEVKFVDFAVTASDSTTALTSDKYSKELQVTAPENIDTTNFQYKYFFDTDTTAVKDGAALASVGWQDTNTPSAEGMYNIYVGMFDGTGANLNQYKYLGKYGWDKTAPTLKNNVKVQYSLDNGITWYDCNFEQVQSIQNVDTGRKYRYVYQVTDSNFNGSESDEDYSGHASATTGTEGSEKYAYLEVTPDGSDSETGNVITISPKDSVGNVPDTPYELYPRLRYLPLYEETATLLDSSGNPVKDINGNNISIKANWDDQNNKYDILEYYMKKTEASYKVQVDIKSDRALTKLELKCGNTVISTLESSAFTETATDGIYTYEDKELAIPADVTASMPMGEIKLVKTYADSSTTDYEVTYNQLGYDATAPAVSDVKVEWYNPWNYQWHESSSLKYDSSTKKWKEESITYVQSGVYRYTYVITDENGSGVVIDDTTIKSLGGDLASYSGNKIFTGGFQINAGGNAPLKSYTVKDRSGNELLVNIQGGVTVDDDIPIVKFKELQKYDGTEWINADCDDTKVKYISVEDTAKYRYVVELIEDYPDKVFVGTNENDKLTKIDQVEVTDPNNLYYYEVEPSKIVDTSSYTIDVNAKDKAGNYAEATVAMPKLQRTKDGITLEKAYVTNAAGEEVDMTEAGIEYTNAQYTLHIIASSDDKIASFKLYDGAVDAANPLNETAVVTNTSNEINRYEAEYTYVIPAVTDVSALFDELKIVITDTDSTPDVKTVELRSVLYDKTEPIITSTAYVEGEKYGNEVKFEFDVTSGSNLDGTNDALESPFKEIKFMFENAAGESQNATYTIIDNVSSDKKRIEKITVPQSATAAGTKVTIVATDAAGNSTKEVYTFYVDTTAPTVALSVNDATSFAKPISAIPTIKGSVTENLTLAEGKITVSGPNGDVVTNVANGNFSNTLDKYYGGKAPDGSYIVKVEAKDAVGKTAAVKTVSFILDRTKPEISSAITSGTKSPKNGSFYNTNVGLTFKCTDMSSVDITVTDNGGKIPVTFKDGVGTISISGEGTHKIEYTVTDKAGNESVAPVITFTIDKTAPNLTTSITGYSSYTESMGQVDVTRNAVVSINVTDTNLDMSDYNYRVTFNRPDEEKTTSVYQKMLGTSIEFSEDGYYVVDFYAVDKANNQSATRTVAFRIDKTAPVLTIGGTSEGVSPETRTVTFTISEAFWEDASGTVNIYRKAGDGSAETLLKTVDINSTARETRYSEALTQSGVYRFEFNASDGVGHTAETEGAVTIDIDKPTLTVTGVERYDMVEEDVNFHAEIADNFYASKQISFVGTRQDADGKVHSITANVESLTGNPSIIDEIFAEDGIYDIKLTVTDEAGNSVTSEHHFTIDKNPPKIEDLSYLNNAVMQTFEWDKELDDIVTDLTVCETHMYLNGSEYDGETELEDGSYTLLVTAVDELGHETRIESISFVIDSKEPTFIVTGVEDGDEKEETYNISVSLQLEEDILSEVTLNGEAVAITNNQASITVDSKGEYELYMKAIDKAGNEAEHTIEFRYGKEAKSWLWLIILCASILVIGTIIIIVVKKRKNR